VTVTTEKVVKMVKRHCLVRISPDTYVGHATVSSCMLLLVV